MPDQDYRIDKRYYVRAESAPAAMAKVESGEIDSATTLCMPMGVDLSQAIQETVVIYKNKEKNDSQSAS